MPLSEVVCGWPRPAGMQVTREGLVPQPSTELACFAPILLPPCTLTPLKDLMLVSCFG